ncbi:hypothetical protein GCM10027341_13240 [Spirosoma knui]
MKIGSQVTPFLLLMGLVASACREEPFQTEQRYKHDLVSEADCQKRQSVNQELNCVEWIMFSANGQVNLLLGGGDIIVRSTYTRTNNQIKIQPASGLPTLVRFKVISSTELIRTDNGTRWITY